jgi:predicted phosphodiesterase
MRLWVLSDLHVDVNRRHPLVLPDPRPEHDVVVIAGDICHGLTAGMRFIAGAGLSTKPVVYVAGNHEFYGFDRHAELVAGRAEAARHPNIHLLERDAITLGGVAFLGCTLWTDYKYLGAGQQARSMYEAARRLNDHRLITLNGGPWLPQHCLEEHEASRGWLTGQLAEAKAPIAVVTHHAPSRRSVQPRYRDDPVTAAFASDLDILVGRATLWVHGHMHAPSDYVLGSCHVLSNPRGYVGIKEDRAFNPGLVVEIPGRP